MFGNALGWPHLVIILAVVLVLFGAPKLPGLARSLGQSMRIFRAEVKTMKEENQSPSTPTDSDASAAPTVADATPSVASPEFKPKP